MPFVYMLVVDLACLASGTYLVITEHYWWAWIPFVGLFSTNVVPRAKPTPD